MKMVRKKTAGVSFDEQILDFLDQLARETGLSRSIVINRIIKEYARRQEVSKTQEGQKSVPLIT